MIEVESRKDGATAIRPAGNLDWLGAETLRHVADDLFRLNLGFVIDLARTNRVDATGARALLATIRRSRALGVDVRIVNPRPPIRRQLESMNNDQHPVFRAVDDGDGAA